MPKRKNKYKLPQLQSTETYSEETYAELMEHEGEFLHSDFSKWNMSKLWHTSKVLRDEAFRRANEFEKAVKEENLSLSQAYARLDERGITWVGDRTRAKFGAKKVDLINNIIETLTFLDDRTSTVEGWREVVGELSSKTQLPKELLMHGDKSKEFFDLYYRVCYYLDENSMQWSPSETMRATYNAMEAEDESTDFKDPVVIQRVCDRVLNEMTYIYEKRQEEYNAINAEFNKFLTKGK